MADDSYTPANSDCADRSMGDEFDGPAGAHPDPNLWNIHIGAGGDDGQLQAYTHDADNASLDGDGHLVIKAIEEPVPVPRYGTFGYSSANLDTHGHLDICYGTISARIRMPAGQGLRPAFWLLGSDYQQIGWPDCGEIDAMELPNNGSTLHGPGGYQVHANSAVAIGTSWHDYSVTRQADRITTTIDGVALGSWTPESLPDGSPWIFDDSRPMYVILNIAVGGIGGGPDQLTKFPASMVVDWVRFTPTPAI